MSEHGYLSRRTLLRGLGAAVALPMLEAMLPRSARALGPQPIQAPTRMAFLYIANGVHLPAWTPQEEGTEFQLPPTLEPLAAHRKALTVLSGLTLNGGRALGDGPGDHARSVASFLTGAHPRKTAGADILNGISVDQVAAEQVGQATRFASLELGTEPSQKSGNCDSGYSCIYSSNLSWRTPTSPMAKEIHPRAVFDRLFGAGPAGEQEKGKWLREEKQRSLLDFVNDDAKSLRQRLGSTDQRKMDEYLHAIREIERRLTGKDLLPTREEGEIDFPRPAGTPRDFGEHVRIMLDMMVLAFQTDSTRIASFMYTNDSSNRSYANLEVKEGHHDLSHHGGDKEKHAKLARINKYHITHVAYFLDKLAAIKEGEKSLLDNAMIVYGSGIGDGDRHNHDNLPVLLMGHGGGIAGGRHLKFSKDTPMCNLYLGMLHRMGVQADRFSDSTEPLPGLNG